MVALDLTTHDRVIESQRLAIDSLHRQIDTLKLERAQMLIELGRAWDAMLDAKDTSDIAYEQFCNCECAFK